MQAEKELTDEQVLDELMEGYTKYIANASNNSYKSIAYLAGRLQGIKAKLIQPEEKELKKAK